MELQNLSVLRRADSGKGVARKTRRAGKVPGVLYGGEGEAVGLSVDGRALGLILHGEQGEHAILQLDVEGHPELNGPVMVKAVQHHPVYGQVTHADFMRIRLDEKITTLIPIVVVGRSHGVIEGGLLDHQLREIEVECLALDVPDGIEVDISELGIGDSIHVKQLLVPEGVTFVTPGDRAVVAIHAPRVAAEEEEAEAEELEEGVEAAEGAEEGEKEGEKEGDKESKTESKTESKKK